MMLVLWQRLAEGKNIKEMDIVMLNHEYTEFMYMQHGLEYCAAHEIRELNLKEGIK
jgi:hypothetical protein